MKQSLQWTTAVVALGTVIAAGTVTTMAQDKEAAVKARQQTMDQEGPAIRTILGYVNDQGTDQATAIAKANELIAAGDKIAGLWPAGTSSKDMPGKTNAKPEIWEQLEKFKGLYASVKSNEEKLLAALQKGDKAAAQAAIGDIGKNGCSACHGQFREKAS
jgi:cytochrome c556